MTDAIPSATCSWLGGGGHIVSYFELFDELLRDLECTMIQCSYLQCTQVLGDHQLNEVLERGLFMTCISG